MLLNAILNFITGRLKKIKNQKNLEYLFLIKLKDKRWYFVSIIFYWQSK